MGKSFLFVANIDDQLWAPSDRALLALWRREVAGPQPPHIRLIDSAIMRELGDYLTVAERSQFGEFSFLFCGEAVADQLGRNLSSRSTSDLPPKSAAQFRRNFNQAIELMAPTFTIDRAADCGHVHLWGRLHLPFRESNGAVLIVTLHRPREYTDELLREILDAAADGILAVRAKRDARGRIEDFEVIAANIPMAELLATDRERLAGETLLDLLPAVREDGAWIRHATVVDTRLGATFESCYDIHGTKRWFRIVSAPLNDGLVISFTDITELKLLTLRLQEQQQQLEAEIARRLKVEDELWRLAHLDALTGIANRRAMHVRATKCLADAALRGQTCAMIVLDIDHFKLINDTHGHAAGDATIVRVAEIARSGLRGDNDIVARMGGEEFAMLLNDSNIEAGLAVAERLRRDIEQARISFGGKDISFTVSFGVAASRDGCTYEQLLQSADNALYRAKRSGRNQAQAEDVPTAA
ncbi:MAG TPA: diguanylate cyclase [Beijerinckiaceae bacterium]|nr:diguanylate cyclase [Beijerinckiaceae bacterium]